MSSWSYFPPAVYSWLLEYDIRGLFDNLNHPLLMKAVKKHTDNKWVLLYLERWLVTPVQMPDGSLQEKIRGVMQGGVISPVLSNLFLHYVFDAWMQKYHVRFHWELRPVMGAAYLTWLQISRLL